MRSVHPIDAKTSF